MNTAEAKIHYPSVTTHTLAHPSPPYYTPRSRHEKLVPPHQDCLRDDKYRQITIVNFYKPVPACLGIKSALSLSSPPNPPH